MKRADEQTMRLYERDKPITREELEHLDRYPALKSMLENLQGNILQGHGRDYSVHIFLRFKPGMKAQMKQWIAGRAKHITSAQQQLDEIDQYRQCRIPGRLFMSFFLSASGYKELDFDAPKDSVRVANQAFTHGMKAARPLLNDPSQEKWEEGYRRGVHAMVLLADDDELFLLRETRKLLNSVKAYADICTVERGRVIRNARGYAIEHFGYVDGRSQPLFFQSDIERESQKGDGTKVWNPGAGPDLVLVPDPYGRQEYDSGSYLVFRKLEQNVRGFKECEKELAKALGLTGEAEKRAGAFIVGRFEDGTPVVLQRTTGRSDPVPNNFTYDDDPDGHKCPFHAHIRKVNSRKKGVPRIVRRGITYDEHEKESKDNESLEELPSQGVGMLFMCYQKNIREQFEFLQGQWASKPNFPKGGTGIDPVIGQLEEGKANQQKWQAQWGNPHEEPSSFSFHGFVTLKGGEYFFAPSIYFLKKIKDLGKK